MSEQVITVEVLEVYKVKCKTGHTVYYAYAVDPEGQLYRVELSQGEAESLGVDIEISENECTEETSENEYIHELCSKEK